MKSTENGRLLMSAGNGGANAAEAPRRRDFFALSAAAMGMVGLGAFGWTLIDSLNPAADVDWFQRFDLTGIVPGERRKALWRLQTVIIHRRTPEEIELARSTDGNGRYPEADADRTLDSGWLVVFGHCTLRGCEIVEQELNSKQGQFSGWLCPCCGTRYDVSGRADYNGPAPGNLWIPPYWFEAPNQIALGYAQ